MSNDEIIEIDENLRTEIELCRQKLSQMDGPVSTEDIPSDIVIDYRGILAYAKKEIRTSCRTYRRRKTPICNKKSNYSNRKGELW